MDLKGVGGGILMDQPQNQGSLYSLVSRMDNMTERPLRPAICCVKRESKECPESHPIPNTPLQHNMYPWVHLSQKTTTRDGCLDSKGGALFLNPQTSCPCVTKEPFRRRAILQPIPAAKALLFIQGVSIWGFVSRVYLIRHYNGWDVPFQTVKLLELDVMLSGIGIGILGSVS